MVECERCGVLVKPGERECPYCGHSYIDRATAPKPETRDSREFSVDRERGTIHFGDGKIGKRPTSGKDKVAASYRYGGGARGSLICSNCKLENPETRINCEACGTPLRNISLQ